MTIENLIRTYYRSCLRIHIYISIFLLTGVISTSVKGQDNQLELISSTIAIRNVTIVQAPGRYINKGDVLIKNGLITEVGAAIVIPPDAEIIYADSMYLYAGFIDGLSHTGVEIPDDQADRKTAKDPGNPSYQLAGIQPDNDVRDQIDPGNRYIHKRRKIGFTCAHAVPYGRMLPGKSALILLTESDKNKIVVKEDFAMFAQLEGASGVYPSTFIGTMAKFRQLYKSAEENQMHEQLFAAYPNGMERPEKDKVLEAFYPIINKEMPVVFKANGFLDVDRILSLRNELGFRVILGEVKHAWDVIDQIKKAEAGLFLSLDIPKMEDDAEEDSIQSVEQRPNDNMEKERLEKRNEEMLRRYYQQPALLRSRGVKFGFSIMHAKSKYISAIFTKFIENGLTQDDLLGALTIDAAEILGVSNIMGTVDKGKMANLIITDKPCFEQDSRLKFVIVEGEIFKYNKEEEKDPKPEEINPMGTWSFVAETSQGNTKGLLIINGDRGDYSGTITNSYTGEDVPISNIKLDDDTLSFDFTIAAETNKITIDIRVIIEGNNFNGTMEAGQFGTFPIKGKKNPNG